MKQEIPTTLVAATYKSLEAARHLDDDRFLGAKFALVALARKIDAWDVISKWAIEDLEAKGKGGRPTVPQNDNVSLASYAKLSEQLGLTPTGQKALQQPARTGAAPEKIGATPEPEGGAADGGQDHERPGKKAKITAIRSGRPVPGTG
jgi:hypothetical protein